MSQMSLHPAQFDPDALSVPSRWRRILYVLSILLAGGFLTYAGLFAYAWYKQFTLDYQNFRVMVPLIKYNLDNGRIVLPPELQGPPAAQVPPAPAAKPPEAPKGK